MSAVYENQFCFYKLPKNQQLNEKTVPLTAPHYETAVKLATPASTLRAKTLFRKTE